MQDRGFVRAEAQSLVDEAGPLLLRGIGLGNWWVREGYMWGLTHSGLQSTRQLEALTVEALGLDDARAFWHRWDRHWITDHDLRTISAAGFDHVRLPLNWRGLITASGDVREDGMILLEQTVERCADAGLRVVLDLHAAPGGQTGTNIDDSPGVPELFLDPHWVDVTTELWESIATTFSDSPAVLAYDLLNEPLPNRWNEALSAELPTLYRQLVKAIRRADTNHLIMVEGSQWATDFSTLDGLSDDNMCWQFHRYWADPSEDGIRPMLDLSSRTATPLYLGETGENCSDWIATMTATCERNGVSWCGWPAKKITPGPCILRLPAIDDWQVLQDWNPSGNSLQWRRRAARVLRTLADAIEDPETQTDVIAAYMRTSVSLPAAAYTSSSGPVSKAAGWPKSYAAPKGSFTASLQLPVQGAPGTVVDFADTVGARRSATIPDNGIILRA